MRRVIIKCAATGRVIPSSLHLGMGLAVIRSEIAEVERLLHRARLGAR